MYEHECYHCGDKWSDNNLPADKDDCGACDPDAER